mmetsp:Transcript_39502/g.47492  ORF Transcript_39502/g.47492 Transcript_39502/m.47492 type:complete len:91 (-) Transcript_39502:56-328(-)
MTHQPIIIKCLITIQMVKQKSNAGIIGQQTDAYLTPNQLFNLTQLCPSNKLAQNCYNPSRQKIKENRLLIYFGRMCPKKVKSMGRWDPMF